MDNKKNEFDKEEPKTASKPKTPNFSIGLIIMAMGIFLVLISQTLHQPGGFDDFISGLLLGLGVGLTLIGIIVLVYISAKISKDSSRNINS